MYRHCALNRKDDHYHVIKHFGDCNHQSPKSDKNMPPSHSQEDIITSQAQYIENLQQQVYCLENETACLQAHMEQVNRVQPTAFAEADNMVKKLSELQKEVKCLKIDLKRKQTSIDLYRSDKERLLKKKEENEAAFNKQKTAYLEQIVELKKERDDYYEKVLELEKAVQENEQRESHLRGDYDTLQVQLEELRTEITEDKALIESLHESKKEIQRQLIESNLRLEMKSVTDNQETVNHLKGEIQELHSQLSKAGRMAEQEKLLRSSLSEDNDNLIKRHAIIEAELADVRAKYKEEQSFRSSLEEIHLKIVLESSEAKSEVSRLQSEIGPVKQQLKSEKDRNMMLAVQVADEKRFKEREEQRSMHLQKLMEQKEEKIKARESQNTILLRDNTALKDEVQLLKEQLRNRDLEVEQLKQRVQEMEISVEEFIQSSKAATRLESQRWRQLTQLALGIQTLSQEAVVDKDL